MTLKVNFVRLNTNQNISTKGQHQQNTSTKHISKTHQKHINKRSASLVINTMAKKLDGYACESKI